MKSRTTHWSVKYKCETRVPGKPPRVVVQGELYVNSRKEAINAAVKYAKDPKCDIVKADVMHPTRGNLMTCVKSINTRGARARRVTKAFAKCFIHNESFKKSFKRKK